MFKYYRSVLAVSAVALGLAACGDNVAVTNPPPATRIVHSVSVVPISATVNVGQAGVTFVASVNADSAIATTVNWTSTNHTVATIDGNGVITALAPGQTTIVATSTVDGSKTGAGSLTVVALPPNISAFSVNPTNATISVGGTLQANSSVTLANGAPAAVVTWASSNANIASVNASGTITGVSAGNVIITATATSGTQTATATVGINVGTGPAGVISFSVSPSAYTLFAGQTLQDTAKVTVAPTFTAPSVTWTSLAPSVATVSGTGLITAQAQGTAVITATIGSGATTLSQSTVITVGQSATISIANVVAGATAGVISNCAGAIGSPVLLSNVNCQIEVNLNLDPGNQRIDSVTVWFKQGTTVKKLARQFYNGTIPAAGGIGLSVNTANFSKNQAKGTTTVDLWNGPTTMIATIWPTPRPGFSPDSSSAINCQIGAGNTDPTCTDLSMVLNNTDGWSADVTKCSGVINTVNPAPCPAANPAAGTGGFAVDVNGSSTNSGKTYWGGPADFGQITAELYPVVYNDNPASPSGSALNRCNNTLGDGTGCISNVNWAIGSTSVGFGHCDYMPQSDTVATPPPMVQVFGSTGSAVTNDCTGHENVLNRRDNVLIGSGARDAQNNGYPSGGLIPNTVVFGATPDSFRLDWAAPNVSTPDISRNAPAVTGWVNAGFSFMGFGVSDGGVGPATTTAAVSYTSVNCPTVTAVNVPMPTGTGADINGAVACPTNFIGGTPGLAGTAPWTVTGTETDLLGNAGTSSPSNTFGTDYTAPAIRWGTTVDGSLGLPIAYGGTIADPVDSVDAVPGANGAPIVKVLGQFGQFRAEYLDERSGFYAAGQNFAGVAAQKQSLAYAAHLSHLGMCQIGIGPVGATFVTNPGCTLVYITAGTPGVRIDGWQPGQQDSVPLPEGYYGYKTNVTDEAGNTSVTLFRSVLINVQSPFSTGLGIPASVGANSFNVGATFADSAELAAESFKVEYPVFVTIPGAPGASTDSVKYQRTAIGTKFDDVITSPFTGILNPGTGAPYARRIEATNTNAFPASNIITGATGTPAVKPTAVAAWSWNFGSLVAGGPLPGVSSIISIPSLIVDNGVSADTFNMGNTTNSITHFRLIPTLATTNQFGSIVPLRAQVSSPSNTPNQPFARVDFYRWNVAGKYWEYLGSNSTAIPSDQGTYRSWVYELATANFKNGWNSSTALAAAATGNTIVAVGVTAAGDGLMTNALTF